MISESERAKILEMIEDGSITAEQGLTLLNALDESVTQKSDRTYDIGGPSPNQNESDSSEILPNVPLDLEVPTIEEALVSTSPISTESTWDENIQGTYVDESFEEPLPFDGEVEIMEPEPASPDPDDMNKWKRWWVIPFWIGAGITVIGGLLMYWAFSATGFGFWFACAWFPFLLGVAVLALAWSSRTTPWLHVRVHQAPGETPRKIAISFPIPIRLTAWGLRTFGRYIPHMEGTSLDEVILALKDVAKDGTPLSVDVNEGENGEHVQVFIG